MNDLNDIIHRQDTPICVGVDVSKDSLQVHVLTDRGQRDQVFANTNVGICKLKKLLQQFPSVLVCCENTGGYELKMVVALQKAKIDVRAVNPKRILAYRQSIGSWNIPIFRRDNFIST